MSEKSIEIVRKYNFDPKEVIAGLNGYYESDKRNHYITIKRNDVEGPAYLSTPIYLSALIEWLREDHDIFYYPGMDIRDSVESGLTVDQVEAAKMCCLIASIKAALSKRGMWFDKNADIPELVDVLFGAYDECVKHRDKNRKELNAIKDTVSQARSRLNSKFVSLPGYEGDLVKLADIAAKAVEARDETISRINVTARKEAKQECYDYLWNALKKLSPECDALKIDRYEDLVDRIFYEMSLVEDGCKRCQRGHTTEKFDYIRRTNKAEEEVKELKEQLDKAAADYQALSEENQKHKDSVFDLEKTCYRESYISDRIHEICAEKGVELDDTFLYNDDYTWEDLVGFLCEEIRKLKKEIGAKESGIEDLKEHITLLEADLKKRAMEIKEVNDKRWKDLRDINKALGCDGMDGHVDDFAKAVKARAECTKRALGEESDINKLIRDYCTKHDIVAPSRYFSDKACVEYLFSIINSKQKDRSFTILQDLHRDIFKKQPDGLSAEDIANKILDRVLETEDLLHKSVDSVNKECKATGKLMVEDYEFKLKNYILKDIKKHGYRYDGLENKSIEEIVGFIIAMATCPIDERAYYVIGTLRGQISRLKDLINAMNEEVGDM